ncbi:DUF4391 domain-containing protein [Allofournierella massiliensis]|uniref:DUF4391 domain-containing protein n=1 Tax=Allofournierella massiliensis TaxID=1650663 RepID=A0ABT7UVE8_9FIRM|nr:DUF4391 domain-containing protein [Fournierella massiliensis]MDM8202283.1 DUF4391 domain-containing protein [Fournierella massiliensis]
MLQLNLTIYTPSHFILGSKMEKYAELYQDNKVNIGFTQASREQGIRRLTAINLMKRMESSVYSFALTLNRITKLAVYHTKLLQTPWSTPDALNLVIKGLTMDAVWENVIVQIGGIQMQDGNTLEQQLEQDEQCARLEKEIARLEKLARAEKQPKKKFELVQRINELRGG